MRRQLLVDVLPAFLALFTQALHTKEEQRQQYKMKQEEASTRSLQHSCAKAERIRLKASTEFHQAFGTILYEYRVTIDHAVPEAEGAAWRLLAVPEGEGRRCS